MRTSEVETKANSACRTAQLHGDGMPRLSVIAGIWLVGGSQGEPVQFEPEPLSTCTVGFGQGRYGKLWAQCTIVRVSS